MVQYLVEKPINDWLRPYIDSYVHVSGRKQISKDIFPQLQKVLVFDFNDNSLYAGHKVNMAIIGHHDTVFHMCTTSDLIDKIMVRFTPYGLSVFVRMPLYKLNNQHINAEDIFGKTVIDLYDQLQSISIIADRIHMIEEFLLRHFVIPSVSEQMIFRLTHEIIASENTLSAGELKNSIPLSVRQIERNFKRLIGSDISQFKRIMRFQRAKDLLERGFSAKLTEIAYASGYYDQAHFSSDFKMLTGTGPKKYLSC